MKIEIEVSEEDIEKVVKDTVKQYGKFNKFEIQVLVERKIDERILKSIYKQLENISIPDYEEIIKKEIKSIDWNEKINNWFLTRLNNANDDW